MSRPAWLQKDPQPGDKGFTVVTERRSGSTKLTALSPRTIIDFCDMEPNTDIYSIILVEVSPFCCGLIVKKLSDQHSTDNLHHPLAAPPRRYRCTSFLRLQYTSSVIYTRIFSPHVPAKDLQSNPGPQAANCLLASSSGISLIWSNIS